MNIPFTRNDWDGYALCYNALLELRPYGRMLEDVLEKLRSATSPVLDAGCGTGTLASELIERGIDVVGVDSSSVMLEWARKKTKGAFLLADLASILPFEHDVFGAVTCINSLYAVPNPAYTLSELFRVLRPNGILVLVTPKLDYQNGLILKAHSESKKPDRYWINAHKSAERETLLIREAVQNERLAQDLLEVARWNRRIARERTFRFFSAGELEQLVLKAGFKALRTELTYAEQNLLLTAQK